MSSLYDMKLKVTPEKSVCFMKGNKKGLKNANGNMFAEGIQVQSWPNKIKVM